MNRFELLRSQSIEQIIGQPPRALIRSGVIVYVSILIFSLVILFSIEYPNIRQELVSLQVNKTTNISSYYCKCVVSAGDANDIRADQKVTIKLNGYAAEKYGLIRGIISHKYLEGSLHYVDISLPDGLRTNTGNSIAYQDGLTGTADITIGNVRLLSKLLNSHRSMYTKF